VFGQVDPAFVRADPVFGQADLVFVRADPVAALVPVTGPVVVAGQVLVGDRAVVVVAAAVVAAAVDDKGTRRPWSPWNCEFQLSGRHVLAPVHPSGRNNGRTKCCSKVDSALPILWPTPSPCLFSCCGSGCSLLS
jgi:hypothetical protein